MSLASRSHDVSAGFLTIKAEVQWHSSFPPMNCQEWRHPCGCMTAIAVSEQCHGQVEIPIVVTIINK